MRLTMRCGWIRAVVAWSGLAVSSLAQGVRQPLPQPDPMPPAIAAPVDEAYGGAIQLSVDLSDNARRVATVHKEIPVRKGAKELVLLYPQWIPGNHSPTGPISKLGGDRDDGRWQAGAVGAGSGGCICVSCAAGCGGEDGGVGFSVSFAVEGSGGEDRGLE